MSFAIKNDKRSNNSTSQNVLTNTLTATTITVENLNASGTFIFNTSSVIVNTSQIIDFTSKVIDINSSGLTNINASSVIITTSNEFCVNASGQAKIDASNVLVNSLHGIVVNASNVVTTSNNNFIVNTSGQFKAAADTILLQSTGALSVNASTVISNGASGDLTLKGPIVSGVLTFSTAPNAVLPTGIAFAYQQIGDMVHLRVSPKSASAATSTASYLTSVFFPPEIGPLFSTHFGMTVINNGSQVNGWVRVNPAGTIFISLPGGFTAASTAGFESFDVSWFVKTV